MGQIIEEGGGKHQKNRAKKHSAHIDMTPMVDLGFLLLTFFVLTSQFSKPKTMEITMPVMGEPSPVNNAITLLLTEKNDKIYYYSGKFEQATTILQTTDYSKNGIRKLLRENNQQIIDKVTALKEQLKNGEIADTTFKRLVNSKEAKADPKAVFVIVKADDQAKYGKVIDVIDELNVSDIGKYALVDISIPEQELIKTLN